uniref:Uncharacterized protein n=1 Tax=Parascaris univalens TaxID=6257 RepID=A0A915A3M2_PARUN
MHHETMALLNVSNGNSRLIYCNGKLSLLFQQCNNRIKRFMLYKLGWDKSACVLCEHEEIIHTIKKRADSSNTDNSMTHSEEALRQRRLNFILTLAFAVPLGILCIAAVIAITICCCFCRKSGSNGSLGETEDDVPQSLIENARKAEPHASQKDKYLPENFDVAQFNFKGPLVIEHKPVFTTFHELEGDPPREQAVTDHVEFDPTMNEAYEIGEGVERLGETSKMPPTLQQQQQQQAIENVRKLNKEAVKEATFVKEVRDALKHARDRQKKSGKEVTGRSATQVKRDKRKLQIHGGLLRNTFDKNVRRSKHTTVEETQATQRSEDSSGWQNKKKKMEPEKPHPVCQQKFVEAHTATAAFLSSAATQSSIWTEAIPVSGSSVETQKSQTTVTGKTQDTSLLQFVRSMPRGKKSSTGKKSTKKTTKNIMTSTRKTVIERSKERATSRATSTDKK